MMYEDIDGPLLLDEISNDTAMMNDHPFDSIEKEIDPHCEIKHKKKNDFNFTSLWRKPRISRRKSKSSSGRKSHHDGFFDENNFDDSSPAVQKTTTRKGRYVKDRESFETTGSIPLSDFDEAKDTIPFLNFRPGLSSRGVGAGVGVGVGVGVNGTTNTNSEASRILKEKTILNPKMFITPTPTKRKDIRSRISEGRMSSERVNKEESDDEVFKSISKNNIFNESPTLLRESPKNKYEIVDVVIKPTPKEEEGKEKDTICGKENLFQNTFYGGDLYQDHGPILSSLSEDSVYSDSIRGERFLPFDKHLDADPTSSNWNHSNDDFVENDDDLWAAHDINMSNHSGEEVQQQPKVEEVPNAEPASIAIETNVTSFSDRLKFYQSKTTSPPAQPVQHPNQNKKWDAHETNNSKLPTSSVQLSLDGGSISDHVDLAFDTFLNLCSPKEAILVETGLEEISEKPSDTAVTGHPIQTSTKAIKDGIFGVNDDKCTNVDSKYSFSKSTNSRREDRQDLDLEREVDTTRAEQPSSVESPTMIDTNASYIASCSLKGGRPSIDSPKILAGRRFRRSGNRFGGVVSRTLGSKAEGSAANKFREDEVHGEGEGDGIDIEQNLYTATTEIKDNTTVEVERASTEPKNEPESNYLQAKCNTSKSELHSESNSFQSSGNIHQRANVFGVTLKKRGGYQGKVISKTETPKTNDFVENEGSVEANDSILKTVNPSAMKEATTPVADEVPVESESKKNIHNLERSCKSSKNKRSHNISSLANIDQEILEDCAGEKLETINADIQLFENAEAELIAAPRVKANKTASLESQKKMAKVDIVQKQSCKLGNNTWKRRGFEERAASIESKTSEDKEHVINMRSNGSSALLETDATSNPTPTLNKKSLATNIVQNNASKFGSTSLKQRGFKARNIPLESRISSDNRDSVIDMESGATTRPSSVKETRRELGPSPAKNEDITDSAVDKKSLDSEEKDPDIQVSLDATKNLHCSESPRTSYVQQKASKFGVTLVKRRNFNVKQVAVNTGSTAAAVGSSGNMHYQNDMNQSAAAKLEIATVDKNVEEETNPESIKEGRTELGQPRVNSRSLSSVGHRINSKNLPSPSKQHDIEGVDSPNPQLHHIPDPRVEHVSPRKEFKSISISERMKMFERANTSNYANPMQSRKDIIQKKAPTSNLCEERDDIDHACGESPKSIESSGSLTSEDPTVSTKRRSTISKIEPGDDDELKILLESETLTSSIPTNNEYENDDVVTDYDRNGNRRMTLKKDSHMENNGTDLGFCEQKSFKQLPPPSPRRRVGHSARRHFFENLGGASREKSHFSRPLVKQDQVVPTNATSPKELEKAPSPYSDNLCETDGPPMFVTVEEDFMLKDNISTCLSASENRSVVCKPPDALLLSVSRKAMTLMSSDDGKKVPKISLSSTLNNATKEANHYDSKRKKQLSRTLIMHRHESKRTNEITTSQQYRRCLERKATSEVILKSEKQEISNMEKDIIQEAEDNNNNSKAEIYRPTVSSSLKARHDIFQSKVGNKCSLEKRQEAPSANNAASELRKVPSSLKARRNVFESKPMDPADRGKRSSFGESTVENKSRKSTTSSRKSSLSFEDVMKARRSMDSARTSSASYSSESVVRPSDLLKKVSSASAASGPQSPLPYRRGFSSTSAALRSSSTGQEKKQQHLRCF